IHGFWVDQEERCRREAFEMLSKLQDFAQEGTFGANITTTTTTTTTASPPQPPNPHDADLDLDQLDEALDRITKMFDPVDFGFGTPKFPNPARLSFLLRLAHFPKEVRDVVGDKDVDNATAMAVGTLRRIRDGGLRDHVGAGAGFMRFSVTSDWSMPHFEKMVGENALLLGVFLDAWLGGAEGEMRLDNEFADVVLELADYLVSPVVRLPAGGFVTSEVADSFYRRGDRHVREGAYYLWTRREFDHVVGGEHDSAIAAAYWNVLEDGNIPRDQDPHDEFINQNVLFIGKDAQELSRQFGIPTTEVRRIVEEAREKLQAHRERERVRPERDEKVVVNTNGTVISALARTAAALGSLEEARSAKYLDAARKVASFVKEHLWVGGVLRRFWYGGKASETRAFADDYAFLIEGLLDLYEATLETEWLDWAGELQDTQTRIFYDSIVVSSDAYPPSPRQAHSGGFYSTELETLSHTILRLKSGMDKSAPSTNAVSASNLFRLGALLDNKAYAVQAKETINAFEAEILQYPWLFVSLLEGVVSEKLGVRKVRVERGDGEGLKAYRRLPRGEARALILVKGEEVKSVEEKLDNLTLQEEGPKEVKAEETTAVDVEGKPEPEVLALPVQKDTKGLDETTLRTEDGQVEPQEQQPKEEEKVLV
ncbi:Six-hairpin glycosidase-like protein, partial [Cercophora scortea]